MNGDVVSVWAAQRCCQPGTLQASTEHHSECLSSSECLFPPLSASPPLSVSPPELGELAAAMHSCSSFESAHSFTRLNLLVGCIEALQFCI